MIIPLYLGIIGAGLIIASWLYETIEAMKRHKSKVDINFAFLNGAGIFILIYYSYLIKDNVFFWLNIVLASIVAVEILYTLFTRK